VINANRAEQKVDQQTGLGGVIWRGEFGPFDRTPFLPNITIELCRLTGALGVSLAYYSVGSQASVHVIVGGFF
jgi:hypothetical protein